MLNPCSSQASFLRHSITHNIRIDGRKNTTRRTPMIKENMITHLLGSSYLYLEYENVEVYTGVKVQVEEIGGIGSRSSREGTIVLELGSMRKLEQEQAAELARMQCIIEQRYISRLQASKQLTQALQIPSSKKHRLVLHIDLYLLSSPHISQLQLLLLSIQSALQHTQIPCLQISYNQVTEQQTIELTRSTQKLDLASYHERKQKIVLVGMVEGGPEGVCFVVDLRREEYDCVDACFLVGLTCQGEGQGQGDKDGWRVWLVECVRGKIGVESINRCVKFVLAHCCGNN